MNFIINYPIFLFLFLPLFICIYFCEFSQHSANKMKLVFSIWPKDLPRLKFNTNAFLNFISLFFYYLAIGLVIFAISSPEFVGEKKIFFNTGQDIMIVLDESPSMFAKDMGGSRFKVACEQLLQFISLREGDSIGLITYSSDAVLQVPPTTDYKALTSKISNFSARDMQLGDSTDIGLALGFACYHLSKCSGKKQFIILITDGVNNAGVIDPIDVAKVAKESGIRIYPVGIGSVQDGVGFSIENEVGGLVQGRIDAKLNDALLERIATITDSFYESGSTVAVIDSILKNIHSIEKSNNAFRLEREIKSLVRPLIWGALFLILLYIVIRKIYLREIL